MSHELREIEIRETPRLSPEQAGILDLHSVLNVLNVLACELQLLGIALENDSEVLSSSLAFCERLASALSRPGEALALVATTDDGAREVLSEVDALIGRHPEQAGRVAVVNGRASIGSVLEVFCVRAKEILARAEHPLEWRAYEPEGLRSGLVQVLRAIESLRAIGGDASFFESLVDEFISDSAHIVDRIVAAVNGNDADTVRFETHALRSSAAHFGARRLHQLCVSVSGITHDALAKKGQAFLADLRREYRLAVEELYRHTGLSSREAKRG